MYKKVESPTETTSEFYLQDAMGKTVALRRKVGSAAATWEYYVNGSEREARIKNVTHNGIIAPQEIEFYLYDHLGNTRVVYEHTYAGGGLAELVINYAADYFSYGKVLREYVNTSTGDPEKFLTTQHERDKETGLDYRGARFYDSDVARFLSIDPLARKYPSLSPYNYVAGNPIMLVDPDGRKIKWGKYSETKNDGDQFQSRKEYNSAKRELKGDIRQLRKESASFNSMYKDLDASDKTYKLFANSSSGGSTVTNDNGASITMGLGELADYNTGTSDRETSIMSTSAHEFGHAWRSDKGFDSKTSLNLNMTYYSPTLINLARNTEIQMEKDAVHIENIVRAELINAGRNLSFKKEYNGVFVKAEQLLNGGYKPVYRGAIISDLIPSGGENKYLSGEYNLKNIVK